MTNITLFRSKGQLVGFEAEGHTGYSVEGEDIVCSAVSALTQTAVIGLTELLKLQIALDINDGELYCMLPKDISKEDCEKAQLILETMALGLSSIAATYGDYINMTERKV